MAVTAVTYRFTQRSGDISKDELSLISHFQVVTDDPFDGVLTVANAVDPNSGLAIPQLFSSYVTPKENCSWIYCERIQPRQEEAGTIYQTWEVLCTYSSNMDEDDNPLDRPPVISYKTQSYEHPVDKDIDGNAVLNSCGQQFDPTIMEISPVLVMNVQVNWADYDPNFALSMYNKVNADTFFGFSAGTVLCTDIAGSPESESDVDFYSVDIEFQIRANGWQKLILDTGLQEYDSAGGRRNIMVQGMPTTSPLGLDGFGHYIAGPDSATPDSLATFLPFTIKHTADFASFDIEGS